MSSLVVLGSQGISRLLSSSLGLSSDKADLGFVAFALGNVHCVDYAVIVV